jgi:ABC-type Mn2+/Zn2+ transport system ATPase subunit
MDVVEGDRSGPAARIPAAGPGVAPGAGPAHRSDPVLVARALTKRYGRREVLRGIDLTMDAGDHVVLVGGNGSGKSTFLRLAVGLSRPTGGTITVGNVAADRAARRPAVAYVPERLPSSIRMTAAQYLAHLGRIRGLPTATAAARAAELLADLRLMPGAHVPMAVLSKGNRQKVALAQAFLVPVALVALDEPTSGLDDEATAALERLVAAACAAGGTVLTAGHHVGHWPTVTAAYRLNGGGLRAEADGRARPTGTVTPRRPGPVPGQDDVAGTTSPPDAVPSLDDRDAGAVRVRLRLPPDPDPDTVPDRTASPPARRRSTGADTPAAGAATPAAAAARPAAGAAPPAAGPGPAPDGRPSGAPDEVRLLLERAAVDDLLARALGRRFSVIEVRAATRKEWA